MNVRHKQYEEIYTTAHHTPNCLKAVVIIIKWLAREQRHICTEARQRWQHISRQNQRKLEDSRGVFLKDWKIQNINLEFYTQRIYLSATNQGKHL